MAKNPPWSREELILALDLYFRHDRSQLSQSHPAVLELSEILNLMPIHEDRPDQMRFRNPNGVYMKICNFLRFDPNYSGTGLTREGKLEEVIWKEFAADQARLSFVATEIRANVFSEISELYTRDLVFLEGDRKLRLHHSRERNRTVVEEKKRQAANRGAVTCEVCGFSFEEFYGDIGKGTTECHHKIPLSEAKEGRETRIEDLALVCANCHRVLHNGKSSVTVESLRNTIARCHYGGR